MGVKSAEWSTAETQELTRLLCHGFGILERYILSLCP
jgi:hypothetical protein